MKHSEFKIGMEFTTALGERKWRCTDVGTRVVTCISLDDHKDDPSWFNGPPYAVVEHVMDEYDMQGCNPVNN